MSNDPKDTHAWLTSGAGNDFIALAEPGADPKPETIRAWCSRGLSVGADGLFVLRRADAPVAVPGVAIAQDAPSVRMTHFNADGTRSELCVNGTRCAARLAFALGWARNRVTLLTDSGAILAHDAGAEEGVDGVRLELPPPDGGEWRVEPLTVEAGGASWAGHRVTVGVPHFVLPWQGSLAAAPVAELGAELRAHPDLGEAGANVDFVRWLAADHFELRTYERGVEAETLACGSGVLATAAVGQALGTLDLPAMAATAGGFDLRVGRDDSSWWLTGEARLVARLELLPAAADLPCPRTWSAADGGR